MFTVVTKYLKKFFVVNVKLFFFKINHKGGMMNINNIMIIKEKFNQIIINSRYFFSY